MPTSFRRTFVTGLLVIMPVLITYWVVRLLFGTINNTVTPVIFKLMGLFAPGQEDWLLKFAAPIVSIVLAVAVIYLIGLIGGNVIGRQVLKSLEALLLHIPIVRGIYSATRQFIDTFSRSDGKSFSGVVLVEFPRAGCWSIGLLTTETRGEVPVRTGRALVSVFVPTTPNPTGGYLLFVPKEDVVHLEMSIDDALKMIISGGVLTPDFKAARAAS
jgi:uncharacterized membrane protein